MTKSTIKRRINKTSVEKRLEKRKTTTTISSNATNSSPFTDADGFQLVLTKKEKGLMKKSQSELGEEMEMECTKHENEEASGGEEVDSDTDVFDIGDDDNMDTQSTVSKSWVRKQLKGPHQGGISRPSCLKRQAGMLRRALLHTRLYLQSKDAVNSAAVTDAPTKASAEGGENVRRNVMASVDKPSPHFQLIKQWADQTRPGAPTLSKAKVKKTKRKHSSDAPASIQEPKPLRPFKSKPTATNNAINSFRSMLVKF